MPSWAERIAAAAATEAIQRCKGGKGGGKNAAKGAGSTGGNPRSDKGQGKGKQQTQPRRSTGRGKGPDPPSSNGGGNSGTDLKDDIPCKVPECVKHNGGKAFLNRPHRTRCFCCNSPLETAAADKKPADTKTQLRKDLQTKRDREATEWIHADQEEMLRQHAAGIDTGLSAATLAKIQKEVEERKKAKPSTTKDVMEVDAATEEEKAAPPEELAIIKARLAELGLCIPEPADSGTWYAAPRERARPSADYLVAQALLGEASETIAAKQAAIEKLAAGTESLRLALGAKDGIYLQSKERLEKDQAELTKLLEKEKKAPTTGTEAAGERLSLARQNVVVKQTERLAWRGKGRNNAKHRHETDVLAFEEAIKMLSERLDICKTAYATVQKAWVEDDKVGADLHKEVLELLDKKIAAVVPAGGQDPPELGGEVPGVVAAALPAGVDYGDLKLVAQGATAADIPDVNVEAATPEQKLVLENVWAYFTALQSAPIGAPVPPTTYEQMGAGHVSIAGTLLGSKIWVAVYGPTREVQPTDLVPWQIMDLLKAALGKAQEKITTNKEASDRARKALRAAMGSAKSNLYCPF